MEIVFTVLYHSRLSNASKTQYVGDEAETETDSGSCLEIETDFEIEYERDFPPKGW